jgi:PPP family 3-phenylpropionic acid transporter
LVERRVSAEALIILAALGGIVRWSCLAFAPVGFVLWPLQLLHACSFAAAHVGAMRLILRDAPERAYALAQTLYSGIATGALMGFATLLSGWLYDHAGPAGYWVMTAMAAGAFIFALALACSKSRATAAIVLSEPD